LPEAQVDRFMMKVLVGYPNETEEYVIVERMIETAASAQPVMTTARLLELQRESQKVYIDPTLIQYAVRLAAATRDPGKFGDATLAKYIMYGASPRASINLTIGARALAFIRGRTYAIVQDATDLVLDVMRHRLVLSYEAVSDGVSSDVVLQRIMALVPPPAQPLRTQEEVHAKR
jgi:MoxR-like ATPase